MEDAVAAVLAGTPLRTASERFGVSKAASTAQCSGKGATWLRQERQAPRLRMKKRERSCLRAASSQVSKAVVVECEIKYNSSLKGFAR